MEQSPSSSHSSHSARAVDRPAPIEIVLPVAGMTCASCVNRIERFLSKTDGVLDATVNLATERATVRIDPSQTGRPELIAAVEAAGYDVRPTVERPIGETVPEASAAEFTAEDAERGREQHRLLIEAVVSIAVAGGIMLLMFWPQAIVPMDTINWLALVPATLIQVWAGRRFYASAWRAARVRSTTMDTLVAIGTSAAWAYSVVRDRSPQLVRQAGLEPATYFDSATIIIGLVLLGRWLEGGPRARRPGRSAG